MQNFRFFGAHLNLFQIFLGESSVKICVNRLKLVFQVAPIELIFYEDLLLGVLNSSTKFQVCLKSFDWLLTFSSSWAETNWLRLMCKLHRACFFVGFQCCLFWSPFACCGCSVVSSGLSQLACVLSSEFLVF